MDKFLNLEGKIKLAITRYQKELSKLQDEVDIEEKEGMKNGKIV